MNLERVAALSAYTTIAALGVLIFCVNVLWSFPLDFPAWFAAMCVSSGIAIVSGVAEIVLRRKLRNMPRKVAVR